MQRQFFAAPMSIAELCEHMGIESDHNAVRRMVTTLRRRERESGRSILFGGGKGCRLHVTLASVRAGFPELVDNAEYVARIVEQNTEATNEHLLVLKRAGQGVGARVRANTLAIERITKEVQALRSSFPV